MPLPIRILLGLHITAGFASLILGLVAMLARKGGPRHRQAGTAYVVGMVSVAFTAALLCLFQPFSLGRLFLAGIAVLSFYLSFTGWRATRRRKPGLRPTVGDQALSWATLLVGLAMIGTGIYLRQILFGFFGGLIVLNAGRDIRVALRPTSAPPFWVFTHIARMCASYIATVTAFLLVNYRHLLPPGAPEWTGLIVWIAPTVIGSFLIRRTLRIWQTKYAKRKPAATVSVEALV